MRYSCELSTFKILFEAAKNPTTMRQILNFVLIVAVFSFADAYSKYGRTCKDIGCPSNQVCVIKEDPCNRYSKPKECGKYPTCVKVSNNAASCSSYVCPPTMSCRMDRGVPKCHAAPKTRSNVPVIINVPPNFPQSGGYANYPSRTSYGQTTSRPNIYQSGQRVAGGGYRGSAVGSGYPGQGGYARYSAQTTSRPNVYQPGQRVHAGGYYGNAIGSGYPRQSGYGGYYAQTTSRPNIYQSGQYVNAGGYHGGSAYHQQGGYPQPTYQHSGYSQRGYGQPQSTSQQDSNSLNALSKFLKSSFNM